MIVILKAAEHGICKVKKVEFIYPAYIDPTDLPESAVVSYTGEAMVIDLQPHVTVKIVHDKTTTYLKAFGDTLLPITFDQKLGYVEKPQTSVFAIYHQRILKHFLTDTKTYDELVQPYQEQFGKYYNTGKLIFCEMHHPVDRYLVRGAFVANGYVYCPSDNAIYYPASKYDDIKIYHRNYLDKPYMNPNLLKDQLDRFEPCA